MRKLLITGTLGLVLLGFVLLGCGTHSPGGMTGPTLNNKLQEAPRHPMESSAILERSQKTGEATVKHILIGWKSLDASYSDEMDPRARARTAEQAEALIKSLLAKLEAGGVFEALMLEHSEDPGSASTAKPYRVHSEAPFAKRFIEISLRLDPGEWGVVRSVYGFHIIKRIR